VRIGQGFDLHALVKGRKLILGGVLIPFEKGLEGHSDADVLIHAVCDALLGAAALGDIGRHFPDTDPKYKNADSRTLLREVAKMLRQAEWAVANVDATIIAQAPRISPHIAAMVANLAADLDIRPGQVNVKAKTAERLGAIGRGEGIAAEAIALLVSFPDTSDPLRHPEAFAG
jgi:2-C-methyl-D-erythritol 2,4-cyclodiphosphate synthase